MEERQRADPELAPIIEYHQTGTLPEGEVARGLAVAWSQYEVIEGILYHLEPDKTLRVVLPKSDRKRVFDEAHAGPFGGHLRDAKVHGQLAKHYWWPRMRGDITRWCRACLVCASRRVGNAMTPPLTPIPVSGPFDRVGVDVIQFPKLPWKPIRHHFRRLPHQVARGVCHIRPDSHHNCPLICGKCYQSSWCAS